jgi:hypothetical protein
MTVQDYSPCSYQKEYQTPTTYLVSSSTLTIKSSFTILRAFLKQSGKYKTILAIKIYHKIYGDYF